MLQLQEARVLFCSDHILVLKCKLDIHVFLVVDEEI